MSIGAISFRSVRAEDLPMLRRWLEAPHVRDWWGEPDAELDHIRDMIEGRDPTRAFLILLDGVPVGYIQSWRLGDVLGTEWEEAEPWVALFPPDTVGVDITLGEETLLSRGIGSAAIRTFIDRLRAEGQKQIIIDPDPTNARAVRAYEKAGFTVIPALAGKTPGVLLMQFRETSSISPP
jgi:RimJ/RimL family protein N-acetyltransferase